MILNFRAETQKTNESQVQVPQALHQNIPATSINTFQETNRQNDVRDNLKLSSVNYITKNLNKDRDSSREKTDRDTTAEMSNISNLDLLNKSNMKDLEKSLTGNN